jgi:hypothetical protein
MSDLIHTIYSDDEVEADEEDEAEVIAKVKKGAKRSRGKTGFSLDFDNGRVMNGILLLMSPRILTQPRSSYLRSSQLTGKATRTARERAKTTRRMRTTRMGTTTRRRRRTTTTWRMCASCLAQRRGSLAPPARRWRR